MIITDFLLMLKGNGIAGTTHVLAHKANMYLIYLFITWFSKNVSNRLKFHENTQKKSKLANSNLSLISSPREDLALCTSLCWNVASSLTEMSPDPCFKSKNWHIKQSMMCTKASPACYCFGWVNIRIYMLCRHARIFHFTQQTFSKYFETNHRLAFPLLPCMKTCS